MSLEDDLKLERYKFVTDRQKYFTELARNSFTYYLKILSALVAGGITLISAKSILELSPELLSSLIDGIVVLVVFLGLVAIGQLFVCLLRRYEFSKAEKEINPDVPDIAWWCWIFEGLYVAAIFISIIAIVYLSNNLVEKIKSKENQHNPSHNQVGQNK